MPRCRAFVCATVGLASVVFPVGTAAAADAAGAPVAPASSGWQLDIFGHDPTITVHGKAFSPTAPDDLTAFDGNIFVNYQNGVGPQGEPAPDGTNFSDIIEYGPQGAVAGVWTLVGKSDGLTADPSTGRVIATLNEDANTSLVTIDPHAPSHQVVRYQYRPPNPLPHGGGTDAIAVYHGRILISASAPGTVAGSAVTPATRPAVYQATLTQTGPDAGLARLLPVYFDGSAATVANTAPPTPSAVSPNPPSFGTVPTPSSYAAVPAEGSAVALALTDPDSNEVVPRCSPRFGGDFVLDSQGDQQLMFAHGLGTTHQALSVLYLSQAVDDSGYVRDRTGSLYVTDATTNEIVRIQGGSRPGQVFVSATPGDANSAVNAPNYLGTVNLSTGTVTAVTALAGIQPKGMIFVD